MDTAGRHTALGERLQPFQPSRKPLSVATTKNTAHEKESLSRIRMRRQMSLYSQQQTSNSQYSNGKRPTPPLHPTCRASEPETRTLQEKQEIRLGVHGNREARQRRSSARKGFEGVWFKRCVCQKEVLMSTLPGETLCVAMSFFPHIFTEK